ncbi:MAG: C25 family cysteine peptidase, partial [Desulfobacterales bacterium]
GVDFEGSSSDFIDIGTWSVSGSALTLQAWVNYESFADTQTILDKSSATYYDWNLSTDKQGGSYRARLFVSDSQLNGSTTFSTGNWYQVTGKYDGLASLKYIRIDNTGDTQSSQTGNLTVNTDQVRIGDNATGADQPFDGIIDEVRISSVARSDAWLNTEYNNQSDPSTFFTLGPETQATAVKLLSFEATGEGQEVRVAWQTAHEINNMGFYLYRAEAPNGPFIRLNDKLMPGADFSNLAKQYEYIDNDVTRGQLYYYRLVDVDTFGKWTYHGPVCVDWDGDGIPDDWEIEHGMDPTVDDALLDTDNDGLTNLEEYERGTDPNKPDTDGDGILDGDEYFDNRGDANSSGSRSISRGVHVLESDDTGITLELRTGSFEAETVQTDGGEFDKLRIKAYVHGYTSEIGEPQVPLKGILLDIPEGKFAHVTILDTNSTINYGYQVYPVPENYADEQDDTVQVAEQFAIDQQAYNEDVFYPTDVVIMGESYIFRDQLKQQLIFYPLSFNPVSGQIRLYERIRVRVDYVDDHLAKAQSSGPQPWTPSSEKSILNKLNSAGTMSKDMWLPLADERSPNKDTHKIYIDQEGLYRLTGAYLDTSGVDLTGVNINRVRLYHLGQQVAISVYDDNGDSQFDAIDYIDFYAPTVDPLYAKYTDNNVYWLVLKGGFGSAKGMDVIDGTPAGGDDALVYDYTLFYELNDAYWQEAPGPDSLDRWFDSGVARGAGLGGAGAGDAVTFDLPLKDVDDSGLGTLKISMYGGYNTDHQVSVSYEGGAPVIFTWSGHTEYEAVVENLDFSEQTGDGKYTLSVTCLTSIDAIVFDWIEATYPRQFVAVDDNLSFTHDSGYLYTITDFSTDQLMVFDVTQADDVGRVEGFVIPEALAPFSLQFETAADGDAHTYLVVAESEVHTTVAGIMEDSASDLGDSANGADYIIVTHSDIGWDAGGQLHAWVDDLAALRQAQGLRVKVVDVQDIYDEFSYGMVTPRGIKDFLTYAYENWTAPAPQYVVVVGDSSYDFKDNWGLGTVIHVPAYLTYTEYMGETVTDEWFVTISGNDAVPDMYIGRLPAKDASEAEIMVAKIVAYEDAVNTKSWENDTLLVADDQAEDFEIIFETMNEDAATLLPAGMNQPYKGYLQDYLDAGFSTGDLRGDILDQINAGTLMVNFSGHGHLQGWTGESIFDDGDIDTLTNTGKYPFIVSMSCLTGYFAYPEAWVSSFVELLLRAEEKGTAAALMPTGMTTFEGQHVLNTALFETIFTEDVRRLGPAIAQAKQQLLANGNFYFEQVSTTFLLFGDPAMKLKVPLPRRPTGLKAAFMSQDGVVLSWDAALDCNDNPVAGYNIYRSTDPSGVFSKLNGDIIAPAEYIDTTASNGSSAASATASGTAYYYVVTSVDTDGDESIQSAMLSISTSAAETDSGGGIDVGSRSCFINTAKFSYGSGGVYVVLILAIMGMALFRFSVQGSRFRVQGGRINK